MRVQQVLADATNTIAEGEVLQLLNCHDADVDESRVPAGHPLQDGQAVRGGGPPRRILSGGAAPRSRTGWPATACTWAPPSS
jgi:hypothetical protein